MKKIFFVIVAALTVIAAGIYFIFPVDDGGDLRRAREKATNNMEASGAPETGTCSLDELGLPKGGCEKDEGASSLPLSN